MSCSWIEKSHTRLESNPSVGPKKLDEIPVRKKNVGNENVRNKDVREKGKPPEGESINNEKEKRGGRSRVEQADGCC